MLEVYALHPGGEWAAQHVS